MMRWKGLYFFGVLALAFGLARSASADTCVAPLVADHLDTQSDEAAEQLAQWKSSYWSKWVEDETDFLRFVRRDDYLAKKKALEHGTEMYGTKNYQAWVVARNILDEIAIGKFEPSTALFKKVHRADSKAFNPLLKELDDLIPNGLVPDRGGVLKRRLSFGRDPLFHPLKESEYEAIKNNPWLSGFRELPPPLSKPGARRGIILYAKPKETEQKLEALVKWYHENKGKMDPVELAARFQHAFVSIHPFVDGNGRTSRLFMDRILAEFDLPPPLLANSSKDIYLTPEQWTEEVRKGIAEFRKVQKEATNEAMDNPLFRPDASVVGAPAKVNLRQKQLYGFNFGEEVIIDNKRFHLETDGFIYNHLGIPHIYVKEKNLLLPVADRTYDLYFKKAGAEAMKAGRYARGSSAAQRDLLANHIRLLRAFETKKIDPEKIEVIDYRWIAKANKGGRIQVSQAEESVFRNAIRVNENDPPAAILNRGFKPQTTFEMAMGDADIVPFNASDVLAQYEKVDFEFWEYLKVAEKEFPELVPEIQKSRAKIHAAARKLLKPYLDAKAEWMANPQALAKAKKDGRLTVFEELLKRSKLNYPDFKTALSRVNDDKVTLLRSDSTMVRVLGFRSQADYEKIYRSLPGSQKLSQVLRKLDEELQKPEEFARFQKKLKALGQKIEDHKAVMSVLPKSVQKYIQETDETAVMLQGFLNKFAHSILKNRYTGRGIAPEFERQYVDYLLHQTGYAPVKPGTSFTSSSNLLTSAYKDEKGQIVLPFTNSDVTNGVFLVELPKSKVHWNNVSTFDREYEFILDRPVGPWRIVKSFKGSDFERADDVAKAAAGDVGAAADANLAGNANVAADAGAAVDANAATNANVGAAVDAKTADGAEAVPGPWEKLISTVAPADSM